MNIQLLTPKLPNFNRNSTVTYSNLKDLNTQYNSYPNLRPLQKDTVSFSGKAKLVDVSKDLVKDISGAKILEEWDPEALSFQEVIDVVNSFREPMAKFTRDLRSVMKHLICTDAKPNNVIMPGTRGINTGVKDPKQTAIKANSRKLFTSAEIEKMGDVGRGRIVLRSASKEDFAQIFEAFGELVKKGYKIREVENYRLTPKDSYVSQSTLDDFEELCQKYGQHPEIKNKSLKNGYTAVHISIELPDGKVIELQLMGVDMENAKEIEDFFYKRVTCKGKPLAEVFKSIEDLIDEKVAELDDFGREAHGRYVRDSYIHARELPARSAKHKFNPEKDFLPLPYFLPKELGYAYLYRMKEDCLALAKRAKIASKKPAETTALIIRPKQ